MERIDVSRDEEKRKEKELLYVSSRYVFSREEGRMGGIDVTRDVSRYKGKGRKGAVVCLE